MTVVGITVDVKVGVPVVGLHVGFAVVGFSEDGLTVGISVGVVGLYVGVDARVGFSVGIEVGIKDGAVLGVNVGFDG